MPAVSEWKVYGPGPVIPIVRGKTPGTADNLAGRPFLFWTSLALVGPVRYRISHWQASSACRPLVVGVVVTASDEKTRWKLHRFGWPLDFDRIFPGSQSRGSRRNVRLVSRTRIVTAMAGRIGSRDVGREKMLATAAVVW